MLISVEKHSASVPNMDSKGLRFGLGKCVGFFDRSAVNTPYIEPEELHIAEFDDNSMDLNMGLSTVSTKISLEVLKSAVSKPTLSAATALSNSTKPKQSCGLDYTSSENEKAYAP